ncbi:DUF4179 domain-containing protein [Planomicrobium sp. CPCC 101079]|uniref:DUF4179 domain-containing protein n=1 Tax=Planomicrobium sp. CPCC 101079 TaxID=2599618 RepID=UPI0011B3EE34|nr:DUF4179 domain-containing protein [Planomicrobium sp. CPCC 101079]TWT01564.1 DUF4179 domain-containing protein [Planomicrobium sp. CPCC 101079]
MYEKEEQKLNNFKGHLEQIPLSLDAADDAIMQGLERAKREKKQIRANRKRMLWSLAAAALLILTLVTTIRVSPAFANAVASIPGLEKFVELIQNDKGLSAVFENDYYQPIGESQTIGNATLTVDGVILDESGMNIFYTIESTVDMDDITILAPVLENQQEVPPSSISFNHPISQEDSPKIYRDILGFTFEEPVRFEDLAFTLDLKTKLDGKEVDFSVPFAVPENVKSSVTYEMNEEVEVEGQKFTIENVTIHPLRVGVKIAFDPANTKKILQFEDMRLEDENGEIWSSISNGISAHGDIDDGELTYFLQSNYFEKPEELYLRINKMQAVDLEDAYFLVDTDKEKLLHSPKDGRLKLTKASRTGFEMTMEVEQKPEHIYGIDKKITDANGALMDLQHSGISDGYDGVQTIDIGFEDNGYANPVKVELFAYPNYINGDVKVELKK